MAHRRARSAHRGETPQDRLARLSKTARPLRRQTHRMADTNYSHASWEDGPPPAWVKDHREYQDSILFSEDRDHGTT